MERRRNNILHRILLTKAFENIYHILHMFLLGFQYILLAGVRLALFIFVIELLFPQDVHIINYALTDKTFKELFENHNYHSAIFVAEGDTSYINNKEKNIVNKYMLRDCYLHVGEYSKAEKIGLEILSYSPDLTKFSEEKEKKATELGMKLIHVSACRDLFRLYEKMGDKSKQLQMYDTLKKYGNDPQLLKVEEMLKEEGFDIPAFVEENVNKFSIAHNLKYDIICGLYLDNPDAAVDSLINYISEVWTLPKFNPSLKLLFLNRLISWHIERNELFQAQYMLLRGIEVVKMIKKEDSLDPLGEFAEYCYILHDYKNAKRFMNVYMRFMDKYYDDDDLEFLLAETRFIKYNHEAPEKQIEELSHCCRGLRKQISNNFAGMTANQRECFAKILKEPFSFSLHLLSKYPQNKDLVELCFENEIFYRGLLLRSDAMLRHALAEAADTSLIQNYNSYLRLKRELVAREEISGPGNFARKFIIEKEISDLEKKLALECADFIRDEKSDIRISDLKSSLDSDECLISYVEIPQEKGFSLAAFVLSKKKGLSFKLLCSSYDLISIGAQEDIMTLCTNEKLYKFLFAKIENDVPHNAKIIYSPAGIINRIPLPSLFVDSDHTLSDKYVLSLVANPMDLINSKSFFNRLFSTNKIEWSKSSVALWGGIRYGGSDTLKAKHRSPVVRGNELEYLPGSKDEVENIELILKDKVKIINTYTGNIATESSFKEKAPLANLIHISTHGFFHEDKNHEFNNPMHNSGLFFANANKAWKEEYRPEQYNKDYEDEILRADEIESLNLSSCNLVVLSACETGLGDINGNEGVYGLQRAFKLAGVRYILMSLWAVPDGATEILMKRFYQNLIKESDIDLAFSNAQKSMRNDKDRIYGIQDWGGFVLLH